MIDQRPFFLLACAAACACAGSAPPTRARDARDEIAGNEAVDSEPSVSERSPYAPTRLASLDSYAWHNPQHPACGRSFGSPSRRAVQAAQVKLSFRGPYAAFPWLPENEQPRTEAQRSVDEAVLDTWGAGPDSESAPGARHDPDFVVASLRARLRGCFSSWLDRRAEAEGSVRFALELGCAGEVQAISAKADGVDEPTVECLFAVVAPATFDAPAGGHATIHVPVVFKNAGR